MFLCLLGIYPLLKFNFSSIALIGFCALALINGVKHKTINFKKSNVLKFMALCSYFLMLIFSITYSTNKAEALDRVTQLSPLIIVPFILSFTNFKLSKNRRTIFLKVFLIANLLFTFIVLIVFFYNLNKWDFDTSYFLFDYDKFQFIINKSIQNDELFVHKAYFSMGFVLCAIFCLNKALTLFSINKHHLFVYLILFFYFTIWIFYAFSFPNIIAFLTAIIILLYFKFDKKYFLLIIVAFLITFSFLANFKYKDIDVKRGLNFVMSVVNGKEYEVNDPRQEIYKSYSSILKTASVSDMLFGFGVGDAQDRLLKEHKKRLSQNQSKNLILYNEEFNNLYWFRNNVSIVSNKTISPDDTANADLIYEKENTNIVSHNISIKNEINKKGLYTFSVFAKKDKSNMLILRLGEINQRAVFDIDNGKVLSKIDVVKATINEEKNQWYRCSITVYLEKNSLAIIGLSNKLGDYVFNSDMIGMSIWGAQLEYGDLTVYEKNKNELIQTVIDRKQNTHNNYLFFLMSTGIIGLLAFITLIIYLFKQSVKARDILKITFCITIAINFLTENILSRHWGLMFFAFMLITLFNNNTEAINE